MRYVEVNPRRAGIAGWMNWPCSSTRTNAENRSDGLVPVDRTPLLRRFPTPQKWKDYLDQADSEEARGALRRNLRGKRPWGVGTWLATLPLAKPVKKSTPCRRRTTGSSEHRLKRPSRGSRDALEEAKSLRATGNFPPRPETQSQEVPDFTAAPVNGWK